MCTSGFGVARKRGQGNAINYQMNFSALFIASYERVYCLLHWRKLLLSFLTIHSVIGMFTQALLEPDNCEPLEENLELSRHTCAYEYEVSDE